MMLRVQVSLESRHIPWVSKLKLQPKPLGKPKVQIDGHESKSPYLGYLLYFHKSQSYTLCNYT